jgi:hypothetical protein
VCFLVQRLVSRHPAYHLFLSHRMLFPFIFIMAVIPQANMVHSVGNLAKEDRPYYVRAFQQRGKLYYLPFFVILLLIVTFNNY